MKYIPSIVVLAATAVLALVAEDKPLVTRGEVLPRTIVDKTKEIVRETKDAAVDTGKRVGTAARAIWIKSRGYLSEDPTVFRVGAEQKLTELREEIAAVRADAGMEQPAYFRTRVLALEQQHAFLTAQLPKLTPEQINARMTGGRFAFDQSVESLEEALDQAGREARTLVKIAVR